MAQRFFKFIFIALASNTLLISSAYTQELKSNALVTNAFESESTSDDFNRTSYQLNFNSPRTDLRWPYENEIESAPHYSFNFKIHSGRGPGFRFLGERAVGTIGKKISSHLSYAGGLGGHTVSGEGLTRNATVLVAEGVVQNWVRENLFLQLGFAYDFLYPELSFAAIQDGLRYTELAPEIFYRPHERWRIISRNKLRWYSDSNHSETADLAAMYGFATTNPWVWVGPALNYVSFANTSQLVDRNGYWAPLHFEAHGLRAETSLPISHWQNLALLANGSWHRQKEKGFAWGTGFSYTIGLRMGDRNRSQGELTYNRIESKQVSSDWSTSVWRASYNYNF